MEWPPYSPDLNPVENLQLIVKEEVYVCRKQYNSREELWNAVNNAANNVSKDIIRNLTSLVDKRLLSLVQKNGGYINTKANPKRKITDYHYETTGFYSFVWLLTAY